MGGMGPYLPGEQMTGDDPDRPPFFDYQIQHLAMVVQLRRPQAHLAHHGLVGPQQQLLPGLAAGVESAGNLGPPKGAVGQKPSVFPGERHPLGGALVDDVHRQLGQPVHVAFPGAVVAPFHRVVEQAPDGVAVVGVVFGGVDSSLGGDGMGPAGGVVESEHRHPVAQFGQGGRRRRPGQAGAHHDDTEAALVGRVDQADGALVGVPTFGDGSGRNFGVRQPGARLPAQLTTPKAIPSGTAKNPAVTIAENALAKVRR